MGSMSLAEQRVDPHIRAINLRTDLPAIAGLVELCFAEHMDSEGRDYLRNMRQTARFTVANQYVGTSPENSAYPFHGYVWVEEGKIIGNLTLIHMRRKGRVVYFIANVATHPDYRGRGIGTALTKRAIIHIREHNGAKAFLQVRDDNPTAYHIYRSLGFEEIARRTTWKVDNSSSRLIPYDEIRTHRRKTEDWLQQKFWLSEIYPPSISWNLPFHFHALEPGFLPCFKRLMNGDQVFQWSAYRENQLIGVISFQSGPFTSDMLWLATSPVYEEDAIRALIPQAIHGTMHPGRITLNYPADRGTDAFHRAGMKEHLTLIWMENEIQSSPLF